MTWKLKGLLEQQIKGREQELAAHGAGRRDPKEEHQNRKKSQEGET